MPFIITPFPYLQIKQIVFNSTFPLFVLFIGFALSIKLNLKKNNIFLKKQAIFFVNFTLYICG